MNDSPKTRVTLYLIVTFALSAVFYALIIARGMGIGLGGRGAAGIKYLVASYLLPIAAGLVVYGAVWLIGLGGFSPERFMGYPAGAAVVRDNHVHARCIRDFVRARLAQAALGERLASCRVPRESQSRHSESVRWADHRPRAYRVHYGRVWDRVSGGVWSCGALVLAASRQSHGY